MSEKNFFLNQTGVGSGGFQEIYAATGQGEGMFSWSKN